MPNYNSTHTGSEIDGAVTKVNDSGVTQTELSYLDGLSSNVQTQLGLKAALDDNTQNIIANNITVHGTLLTKDSQNVNIGDAIITLNYEETGTPTENAGIEVERGTSTNVLLRWNETADRWEFTNDGTTYYNIPISTEYATYVSSDFTHDDLTGFVANEHIDHSTITLTAGTGLSGGGDITASRSFAVDLNELTTETTIADEDFIAMVDATDNGSGKITFENLEDAIFASVSGDILITEAGVATIQANSVALGTDTTGNYVASIIGGEGITSSGAATGEGINHSLSLDLNELTTETTIADADFIAMVDATDSGSGKITFANFKTSLNQYTDWNLYVEGVAKDDVTSGVNVNFARPTSVPSPSDADGSGLTITHSSGGTPTLETVTFTDKNVFNGLSAPTSDKIPYYNYIDGSTDTVGWVTIGSGLSFSGGTLDTQAVTVLRFTDLQADGDIPSTYRSATTASDDIYFKGGNHITTSSSQTGSVVTITFDVDASVNADTVDSLHASSFLRSDAADSFSGKLTWTQGATVGIDMANGNIANVNNLTFNDPGVNEGLEWVGGNGWKIYESPNGLTNAAGNLQFVTTSTRRMTLDTSGNLDVTGDLTVDTTTLKVDSTNNRVGIGTASPAKPLEIEGSGAEAELIYLTSTQASNVSNRIRISHRLLTDSQERTSFSLLSGFNTITDASRNSIVEFKTSNAGTFGTAMVIDGGNVGIGETNPAVPLHITGGNLRLDHTRPMIQFEETDGTADQNWQLDVAAGVFRFQTNNDAFSSADTKVEIDQSGNVTFAGSVYLTDTNTQLSEGAGDSLKITTATGYVEVGPRNSSWSHFITDRQRYYFDKGVTVNQGLIGSYDENLQLQTSGTTRLTLDNSTGNATFTGDVQLNKSIPYLNIGNNGNTTLASIRLGGDNSSGGRLFFQYNGDSSYIDCYGGHGSTEIYRNLSVNARNLYFKTGIGTQALYIDNDQNSTFAGQARGKDGSTSSPSFSFSSDTNTGMYRVGTDAVGLVAGGSRKFYINSTTAYFQNLTNVSISSTTTWETSAQAQFEDISGNVRGYIGAGNADDKHFAIATTSGEDIGFLDNGIGGTLNAVVRGNGDFWVLNEVLCDMLRFHDQPNVRMDGSAERGELIAIYNTTGTDNYVGFELRGKANGANDATKPKWAVMAESVVGFYDDTNNKWGLYTRPNAETRLFYSGSEKLQTTSNGIMVGGNQIINFGSNSSLIKNDSGQLELYSDNEMNFYTYSGGWLKRAFIHDGGNFFMGADTNGGYLVDEGTYCMAVRRVKFISFNWDANYDSPANHGIMSTNNTGAYADSMSINSYNDITLRIDSNNNNTASYVRFMNDSTGSNQFGYIGFDGSKYLQYLNGTIRAATDVVAYYSDARLKDFHGKIENPIEKVMKLNGYYFTENAKAKELGFYKDRMQVGVSAQEIKEVLPELIESAPINDGKDTDYMTIDYSKITPLLIEAIKEQQKQINELKKQIGEA